MRKVKSSEDLSPLAEHKIRTGARGPRVFREHSATPYSGATAKTEVWVPLIGFEWSGTERKIDDNTSIRSGSKFSGYRASDVSRFISSDEKDRCRETSHWLFFTRDAQSPVSAASYVNAFLLTLWIVRPTPTYVAIRFEKSPDSEYHAVRVLDRFQWIRGRVSPDVSDDDLSQVSGLFRRVLDAYVQPGRLRNALVLAFRGCVSKDWQPAALCFGAALATLSRASATKPIREQMVARLTALGFDPSGISAKDVTTAYKTAESILEGSCPINGDADTNLDRLAKLSEILRGALRGTLASEDHRTKYRDPR